MFGTQHLALFIVSGLLLNITPGQDTLYVVGRSLSQGTRAGFLSSLGIAAGSVVHTFAAAFGLSAILATSAHAFLVVKIVGAAYLTWLGVRMLLERARPIGDAANFGAESAWRVFRAGFLTNVLNPKVALFYLAFLPQFVSPDASSRVAAFLFLGGVFLFNGMLWCLVLVYGASAASKRLRNNPRSGTVLNRIVGSVFIGLGLKLAVSE